MISVVFYFMDSHDYPGGDSPQSVMSSWVHDVRAFGADRIIMIDKTSFKIGQYYKHNDESIIFERYDSLEECMEKYKDQTWVFIELDENSINLEDFNHPKNCFYVVGPDTSRILNENPKNQPDFWVKIPMLYYRPLYSHVAMMVVLYDRMVKLK